MYGMVRLKMGREKNWMKCTKERLEFSCKNYYIEAGPRVVGGWFLTEYIDCRITMPSFMTIACK